MRKVAVLLVVLVTALLATTAASAATIKLGWNEKLRSHGKVAMTYGVEALATNKNAWAVRASFSNKTTVPIKLGASFGIAEYVKKNEFDKPARFLPAIFFQPALPKVLKPGQTWKGIFGGVGVPNAKRYVRVVFGAFASQPQSVLGKPFTWITDHAHHKGGLVI